MGDIGGKNDQKVGLACLKLLGHAEIIDDKDLFQQYLKSIRGKTEKEDAQSLV